MKDEGDPGIPDLLQSQVLQALLTGGVEPERHVGVAVRVVRRGFDLHSGHTSPALELVVGLAGRVGLQLEEVPQVREGEVALNALLLVQSAHKIDDKVYTPRKIQSDFETSLITGYFSLLPTHEEKRIKGEF